MSQIEDLRKGQSNHEERLQKLESLINPFASELQEGAKLKAVENLLDDAPAADGSKEEVPTLDPTSPPPQTPDAPQGDSNEELKSMQSFLDDAGKPSVNGNGESKQEEESKDEAN